VSRRRCPSVLALCTKTHGSLFGNCLRLSPELSRLSFAFVAAPTGDVIEEVGRECASYNLVPTRDGRKNNQEYVGNQVIENSADNPEPYTERQQLSIVPILVVGQGV
jgi:hypothetical protein